MKLQYSDVFLYPAMYTSPLTRADPTAIRTSVRMKFTGRIHAVK